MFSSLDLSCSPFLLFYGQIHREACGVFPRWRIIENYPFRMDRPLLCLGKKSWLNNPGSLGHPTGHCCCRGGHQEEVRDRREKSSTRGRQPQPKAVLGMHRASFVGKIRIRLVPDPLEQSLEAFEVGLSPARKAENQFGWQTRAPKSSVHAP